ncbi:MAG TPA: CBS domain-containing protein, partial [Marinobacter sp.]
DGEEHPVRIITDRDIAMGAALQNKPLRELCGEDISSHRELHCCGPDASITTALQLMESQEIRRLLVVNQYNQLCGIVSLGDIVSFTGSERAKKSGEEKISSKETMELLRHISAHHPAHKATAAV